MLPPVSASVLLPLSLLSLSFAPLPGPLPILSALSGHSPFFLFFFCTPPALNLSARTLSRSSVIHLGLQHLSLSLLLGCFFRHCLTHSVLHASTVSWVSHSLLPSPLQDSLLRTCHPICVLGFSLVFQPGCSVTSGGHVSPPCSAVTCHYAAPVPEALSSLRLFSRRPFLRWGLHHPVSTGPPSSVIRSSILLFMCIPVYTTTTHICI